MRDIYKRSFVITGVIFLVVEITCVPRKLIAQSFLQSWSHDSQVSLEWYHPYFSGSGYTMMTGVGFISVDLPIGGNIQLKADLPFTYEDYNQSWEKSQFGLGSPYIGVQSRILKSSFFADFGVRLGISDKSNFFIGENSDYYRFSATSYETWVFRANLHYIKHLPSGLSYQFLLGSFVTVPNRTFGASNLFLNYGVHLRYQHGNFLIGTGIKGIAILTGSFMTSEYNGKITKYRLSHQYYLEFGLPQGNWTPSLYMGVPFDDYISGPGNLKFIFGLRANIYLSALN